MLKQIKKKLSLVLATLFACLILSGCFKKFESTSGDTSKSEYDDITRVSELPSCLVRSTSSGWHTVDDFELNFECYPPEDFPTDLIEKVECQNTRVGTWAECDSRLVNNFSSLKEGSNTLRIRAESRANRVSPVKFLTVKVDTLKPSIESLALDGIYNNVPRARFTPSDDASGSGIFRVLCKVEGSGAPGTWYSCGDSSTRNVDLLNLTANETYDFSVKAEDNAGNESSVEVLQFLTAFVAPSELCAISPVVSPTQLTTVPMNFSCASTQPISKRQCRLSGQAWQNCQTATQHILSGLADGNHTFEVRFRNDHNMPSPVATKSFVVDTTPPVINITSADTLGLSSQFAFTTDDSSGISRVECSVAKNGLSPSYEACSQNYFKANLAPGFEYRFLVRAVDNAGNAATKDYIWNTTPPTGLPVCSITSSFPNGYSTSADSTMSFSCFSPHGNVSYPQCRINGEAFGDCSSVNSHIVNGRSDGETVNFCVQTKDLWERPSPLTCLSWKVSTVGPTMNPIAVDIANPYARLFFGSDTPSCPITRYECQMGGPSSSHGWQTCESPKIYSGLLLDQNYTFKARAVTLCNQTSPIESITWSSRLSYQGPRCELVAEDPKPWHTSNTIQARIECEAAPTADKYECSNDGTTWAACTSPVAVTSNATGTVSRYVRGVDDLEVRGPISQAQFNFDLSDPTISISRLFADISSAELFFSVEDQGSGIDVSECKIDGVTTWANCSSPAVYSQSSLRAAGASFTFRARTKDRAGRLSAEKSYTWRNGAWTPYGACVRQPDGSGLKTRTCSNPSPLNGGYSCSGSAQAACTPPPPPTCSNGASNPPACTTCPIGEDFAEDGSCKPIATNSGWGDWGACTASCGGGYQLRDCAEPKDAFSQSSCNAGTGQARLCNMQECCLPSGTYLGKGDVPGYSQSEVTCHSATAPPPVTVDDSSLGCCSNKVTYSNPTEKTVITCGPGTNCSFCTKYTPGVNQPNYNWDAWNVHCK